MYNQLTSAQRYHLFVEHQNRGTLTLDTSGDGPTLALTDPVVTGATTLLSPDSEKGPATYFDLQGRPVLYPTHGIFINSNIGHMSRPTTPESARYLTLNVQPSLLTLFHGSVVEQKYFLPYIKDPQMQVVTFSAEGENELLFAQVSELFRVLQDGDFGYELEAYSRLLAVWHLLLLRRSEAPLVPPQLNERYEARAILSFLHEHYGERLTLDDIAAEIHVSKSECCRLFQSSYGCSIFTYLTDYRLQKSVLLLTDSLLSVLDISDMCGFNSTSYFIKRFREKVGMTPLQYRKKAAQSKH